MDNLLKDHRCPRRRSCARGFCLTQSQICRGRARPALRLATNQTLVILRTSDKDVRRISTLPPAQNYRRVRFLSPLQSAGTALLFAQPRIAVISSALVTLNGCVAAISASKIPVESCCFWLNAVYNPAAITCSISAPENPPLAPASFGKSNPAASLPRFRMCKANSAARDPTPGKSTKKISSNLPYRSISGGKFVMLFDVAAKHTPLSRSCIHVTSVASNRCDNPASASPLEPAEANAFSISSIHNTTGEIFCATSSAFFSRFSLSPTNLSYSAPASSRASS